MTTTDSWAVNAGGDWKMAADWSTGHVPGSANDAVISTSSVQTITYTNADKSMVDSLTVGRDIFAMSGGQLNIFTTASFADGLQQSGGTLQGGTISLLGASAFTGGSMAGSASLTNSGSATVGAYAIDAAATFINAGTLTQTGRITFASGSGTGPAILNEAGTYDLATNVGIVAKTPKAGFTNDALLEKNGAAGTSVIGVNFTNAATGTISALAGNLEFTGKTIAFGGTLNGPAEISVGAGTATIAAGTSIDTGTFGVLGKAVVDLAGSVSIANLFDEAASGNTTINVGSSTLTLTGAANAAGTGGAEVFAGSGSVVNNGSLTVSGSIGVARTLSFINDGIILDTGTFGLGGLSSALPLVNAAGATFELGRNAGLGTQNGAAFSNAGTLAKISGVGTSTLADNVTSTGLIKSEVGVLDLSGTKNAIGGTISGAGTVAFDQDGVTTLETGLVLGVATLDVETQATLVLAGSQSFAGKFSDTPTSTTIIELGGFQLALLGRTNFGNYQAIVEGPGTLATSGTVNLSVDGLELDGKVTWQNGATVNGDAPLTLGGNGTVTIVNAASGTFNVNDDFSVTVGSSAAAYFTNAGLFEQTGPSGVVTLGVDFTNTGTIIAATGLLDFVGAANTIGGLVGGVGTVAFDGNSVATLEAGVVLSVATIDVESATLALATDASYAQTFEGGTSGGSPTLSLGDHTLTLSGQSTLDTIEVDGAGTLITSGTTTLGGGRSHLVGTAVWSNTGTFDNQSNLDLGNGSSNIVQFINTASGVYETSTSINPGDTSSSAFTNAGTFDVLATGDGQSIMGANFNNTGLIDVASDGDLLLRGPTSVLEGTLMGAGTITLGNSVTFDAASPITVSEVDLDSGQFTLSADQTMSGFVSIPSGYATLNLDGYQLTLNGAFFSSGANGFSTSSVNGPGTLVTNGSSTVTLAMRLDGGTTWINNGNFNDIAGLTIGDAISGAALFINAAGGVFDIGDGAPINMESSTFSTLTNDGLFEKTGGGNTSQIYSEFINTGTISVSSGTIEFVGYSLGGGNYESLFVDNGAIDPSDTVTYGTNGDVFISAPASASASAASATTLLPDFAHTILSDASGRAARATPDRAYSAETIAPYAQASAGLGSVHLDIHENLTATAIGAHGAMLDHS